MFKRLYSVERTKEDVSVRFCSLGQEDEEEEEEEEKEMFVIF